SALLADARDRARDAQRPVLVSVVEQVPAVDAIDALAAIGRAATHVPALAGLLAAGRALWTRPADDCALVGLGAAATFTPDGPDRFATVDRAWNALLADAIVADPSEGAPGAGPVLVGGFSFEPNGPRTAAWRGFPSAQLTLPRLQLAASAGTTWLTTNVIVGADGRADVSSRAIAQLRDVVLAACIDGGAMEGGITAASGDTSLAVADVVPGAEWRALVGEAVEAIGARAFEKVVLARSVHAAAPCDVDVLAVLRQLRTAHPDCYVFAYWRDDRAFVGASPERLVRVDGRVVRASSLAGSARRGSNPSDDARSAAGLMASVKDRAEHALVLQALRAGLAALCDDVVAADEPELLALRHVFHLHTPVRARLRPGRSLLDVVARLHPTPAVGGTPREPALAFLRARERLDRGWYAAPVGWVGRDGGEFAVALRSAVVAGREAWLFAGCGIVAGSDPDAEYAESRLKLRSMTQALTAALAGAREATRRRATPARP
ncbi:MAG TPA: isochorismate synthase, partial [Gemmatirosa sp.]